MTRAVRGALAALAALALGAAACHPSRGTPTDKTDDPCARDALTAYALVLYPGMPKALDAAARRNAAERHAVLFRRFRLENDCVDFAGRLATGHGGDNAPWWLDPRGQPLLPIVPGSRFACERECCPGTNWLCTDAALVELLTQRRSGGGEGKPPVIPKPGTFEACAATCAVECVHEPDGSWRCGADAITAGRPQEPK